MSEDTRNPQIPQMSIKVGDTTIPLIEVTEDAKIIVDVRMMYSVFETMQEQLRRQDAEIKDLEEQLNAK